MEDPGKLTARYPAETGADTSGISAVNTYEPVYSDPAPTSGARQFWWLAGSVPFGRAFVIGVTGLALLGIGFAAGRLAAPVVVREAPAESSQPVIAGLPGAPFTTDSPLVIEADLEPPLAELPSPTPIQRQPRLPWRDWTVDTASFDLTSRLNVEVSSLNRDNMEQYTRRISDDRKLQRAPSPELYYVTRRTPAYDRLARYGDRPASYVMPGTPLLIQQFDPRWALVMPPGREALWVRATALTTEKTHRYW